MSRQGNKGASMDPPLQVGDYRLEKTIGQGTYGKVRLGVHIETGDNVAIKVIEKSQIQSPKQVARLQREIRFLKLLNHPHIVKVLDVIETQNFIYIIMEYAVGGELFDYIVANKRVEEKEARSFFRMVLSAVDYCHENAIIHRDLKPENLLLDEKKNIKIIDFGFGNNYSHTALLDTFCGSPFYAAPEMILGKKYEGPEVDMWSLGVILFALMCGHLPFDDDNMKELYKKIANGNYKTPDYLPGAARHLIGRLITVDPKKRATLKEVLQHPWVNEGYSGSPNSYVPLRSPVEVGQLSRDITNRLEIFGYTKDAIQAAFTPPLDYSKPCAIRATYYLLLEMVTREQARLKAMRKEKLLREKNEAFNSESSLNTISVDNNGISRMPSISERRSAGFMNSTTTIDPSTSQQSSSLGQYPTSPLSSNQTAGYTRLDVTKRGQQRAVSFYRDRSKASDLSQNLYGSLRINDGEGNGPRYSASHRLGSAAGTEMNHTPRTSFANTSPSGTRRQSAPLMIGESSLKTSSPTNFVPKLKEELRAVQGWFINYSTTTAKSQQDILSQLFAIVGEQAVTWNTDGKCMFQCHIDLDAVRDDGVSFVSNSKPVVVGFQVEISRVPRMNLQAIHFKRLTGGLWNYKKLCSKIMKIKRILPKENMPPKLAFGTMTFGKGDGGRIQDLALMAKILSVCKTNEITELDTARMYCDGNTEQVLSQLNTLDFHISTKAFPFLSGDHQPELLRKQFETSLAALKANQVDIFYLHAPDNGATFEETLETMDMLFREGKFRRFGLSNYSSWQVMEIYKICQAKGYVLPVVYQGRYSCITRDVEPELFPCLRKLNISFYAYNPLAGGFLVGNQTVDSDIAGRFQSDTVQGKRYRERYWKDSYFQVVEKFKKACISHSLSTVEVALRWVCHHSILSDTDVVIIGASTLEHLEENIRCCKNNSKLPDELLSEIEECWKIVQPFSPRYFR